MINFPFGTNGKLIILGIPVHKHITVGSKWDFQVANMLLATVYFESCPVELSLLNQKTLRNGQTTFVFVS